MYIHTKTNVFILTERSDDWNIHTESSGFQSYSGSYGGHWVITMYYNLQHFLHCMAVKHNHEGTLFIMYCLLF